MAQWLTQRMSRDRVVLLLAVVAPVAVSMLILPWRDHVMNIHVALVMVLVITSVAATGRRLAGVVASVCTVVCFDFFFTQPFERFVIDSRVDVQTSVLLFLVGLAITQIAVWGRQQQVLAGRAAGYLDGIHAAAQVAAAGGSSGDLIVQVSAELNRALQLRTSYFQLGVAGLGSPPRLRRDGQIEWNHAVWDVEANGLPVDSEIELLVENGGLLRGRFMLTAAPGTRVSLAQRRVAVTLADQVAMALA